jgi:uncharacterized integral membrane protein
MTMARRRDRHEPLELPRTRTSSVWVAVAVGIVLLVLLIIFIAQNDRKVPIHFLGANGTVSEALALIAAALAGAVTVFAIGAARIVQLRIAGRRHNKAVERHRQQAAGAAQAPVAGAPGASAAAAPDREAKPVQTEDDA